MRTVRIQIFTIRQHKKCVATAKALKAHYKRKMWQACHDYYNEFVIEAEYPEAHEFKPGLIFRDCIAKVMGDIWKDENTVWVPSDEAPPLGFVGVMTCAWWDVDKTLYVKNFKTVPDEKN